MYIQNRVLNVYGASNSMQGVKRSQLKFQALESGCTNPDYDAPIQHIIPFWSKLLATIYIKLMEQIIDKPVIIGHLSFFSIGSLLRTF